MRRAIVSLLVLSFLASAPVTPAEAAAPCRLVEIPGLGLACPVDGGYELAIDAGTGLRVHGHDVAWLPDPDQTTVQATPSDPICVTGDYALQLIYARPTDRASQASTRIPQIRALMRNVNGRLEEEAAEFGASRSYRVRCDGSGVMDVRDVVLPTSSATDSFDTVVADLRAQGFNSNRLKYAVWYEGGIGNGILGTGHVYYDDSNSVNNNNNASSGSTSMFAALWGDEAGVPQYEATTWMHEIGHNMGAVQLTAPNSSGAGHCIDGRDIMCYFDGGPRSPLYATSVCTDREHFDCRHDDYFHPSPTSGYLTSHWNVGSTHNRFLATATTTLRFTTGATVVSESAGSVTVTVERVGATTGTVGVSYATGDGTALAGSDYTSTSGTLSFGGGVTSRTITVPVAADGTSESDESFTLTLSAPTGGAGLGSPSAVTITITDPPAAPTLRFDSPTASIGETAGAVDLIVRRLGDTSGTATVAYASQDGSATGVSDYTPSSGTLTFGPGVTTRTVSVPVIGDERFEGDESFTMSLSSATGATIVAPNPMSISIVEDDSRPTLALSSATTSIAEGAESATVTVTRTGARDDVVSVSFATSNGTAGAGADYSATSTTLAFGAGVVTRTVSIPILQDTIVESTETFSIALSAPGGVAQLGVPSTGTVQILDDDGGVIRIASGSTTVPETQTIRIPVTRTLPGSPASVSWALTPVSPSGVVQAGALAFASGVTALEVTFSLDDSIWTGTRTFSFALSNPSGATLGSPSSVTVTLLDDEPAAVLGFDLASSAAEENAGTVAVAISRSGSTTTALRVTLDAVAGTAALGSDATVTAGVVTFAPGEVTRTVPVAIVDDAFPEGEETLSLRLKDPSAGALLGVAEHRLTIAMSDQQPDLMVQTWPSTTIVGNDEYAGPQESTGAAPRGWNGGAVFRVQNDGTVPIPIVLKASETGATATVTYRYGATDITDAVRGTGFTVWLDPSHVAQISIGIAPPLGAIPGSQRRVSVVGSWLGDGVRSDTATAVAVLL